MTTSELFRRDPQKGKKEFSAHKGFTIIELMIVIGVIAVITSLALPSYRTLIEKRQVTSGVEQVTAFLSAAQMEAVKRNQEVAISCTVDACEALVLPKDETGDEESIRVLDFSTLKAAVVAVNYDGDDERVVFDPVRGMLRQDYISTAPIEIQLSSAQGEYAVNVTMSPTGRVTKCSDAERASKAVPGYSICEIEVGG